MSAYQPPCQGARYVYVRRGDLFDLIDLGGPFPTYLATADTKEGADVIVTALRWHETAAYRDVELDDLEVIP